MNNRQKTTRLSSNLTIFLKIFIPIFYVVFFGGFLLANAVVGKEVSPLFGIKFLFATATILFLSMVAIMYFTIIKLKRIDANSQSVIIGNYVKYYRYPWKDIQKIKIRNYIFFKIYRIYFKDKASFGRRVSFLPSRAMFESFVSENPNIVSLIEEGE